MTLKPRGRVTRRVHLPGYLLLLCGAGLTTLTSAASLPAAETQLRVMTFNIWTGGEAGGQPLNRTADVIRRSRADIVGIQESHGREVAGVRRDNGDELAALLGWNYQPQAGRTGVLSRFPMVSVTPQKMGVVVEYAAGRRLHFYNVHFAASPYQPYQLLRIPYGEFPFILTASEAVEWAHRARGDQVSVLIRELRDSVAGGATIVLTGDFNEPSYLDWTDRAQQAGRCPLAVQYPATRRVAALGLRDTFRVAHPDEVQRPGLTWTPLTSTDDPQDHHDRIDFVFASAGLVRVIDSQVVGESAQAAGIVVKPWPSDHRAVVSTLSLQPTP